RRRQPLRGDSVAAWGLLVPDLPVRHHASVEHALALGRMARPALSADPVVRRRLHGQPLRGRPPDRVRLRHRRVLRRALVLAAAGMARVTAVAERPLQRTDPRRDLLRRYRYPLVVWALSRLAVYLIIAMQNWTDRHPRESGISWHALFADLGDWDATWYEWIA